jgi:lysophospholipase L1-like esterase
MWKKVLLVFFSLVFAVILTEAFLRWHVPPIAGPSFSEYDPEYGRVVKKNQRGYRTTPEYNTLITTNSLGTRGPDLFQKWPADAVLFLGDSFTFGIGVSDGEEYPQLIAQKLKEDPTLRDIPVLNLGIGGNGNGRWLKLLREENFLKPKLIVMQLHFSDFGDNLVESFFQLGTDDSLIEVSSNRTKNPSQLIQDIAEFIPGADRLYLVGLIRHLYAMMNRSTREDTDYRTPTIGDRLTYRIIEEIMILCRDHSWPLLIVSIDIEGQRQEALTALCAAYRVRLLSFPSREKIPDWYYTVEGHWTPKGHRLAAEEIFPELRRLLSPQPGIAVPQSSKPKEAGPGQRRS